MGEFIYGLLPGFCHCIGCDWQLSKYNSHSVTSIRNMSPQRQDPSYIQYNFKIRTIVLTKSDIPLRQRSSMAFMLKVKVFLCPYQ